MMTKRLIALLFVTCALSACQPSSPSVTPADLVVTNGKIVTVDDTAPEVQAVAIRGERRRYNATSERRRR
jgi:hypothetical protein